MEESAQILEIETFIPLLLQEAEDGHNRLKRVILIGDHHQLPPVIKNMAFQKYCNMEQSLFTRFIRLGVPAIELDRQGRSRASIANLYNWRYKKLGNLPHVLQSTEYLTSNAGFAFDFQLVNVEDFNGVGESEPNPYFYQNLAEAEYCVAVYMYMRLLGYPAEKISILTTYNGQKHLIRDVLKQRCGDNPVFGFPLTVTTVDRYQGSQNNFILLSLVRTKNVGHLRDVRRLIVAMSRARLGLYVFGRVNIFSDCYELTPAFRQLLKHPTKLHICPNEVVPTTRCVDVRPQTVKIMDDMPQMSAFVYSFYYDLIEKLTKEQEEVTKAKNILEAAAQAERDVEEEAEKKRLEEIASNLEKAGHTVNLPQPIVQDDEKTKENEAKAVEEVGDEAEVVPFDRAYSSDEEEIVPLRFNNEECLPLPLPVKQEETAPESAVEEESMEVQEATPADDVREEAAPLSPEPVTEPTPEAEAAPEEEMREASPQQDEESSDDDFGPSLADMK